MAIGGLEKSSHLHQCAISQIKDNLDGPAFKTYTFGEFYHHSLVSVIKEQLSTLNLQAPLHPTGHKLFWMPDMKQPTERVRVYGEMYTSRAFLESQWKLLESPPKPGCCAPHAIIVLMFWSDETQLTSFGQAKLWPLYMYSDSNNCPNVLTICNVC